MKNVMPSAENQYSKESKGYKAFLAHIIRMVDKPKNPTHLVHFYLESFLLFTRKINASTVIGAGFCEEGQFTKWRNSQKRAGNLDWDTLTFAGNKTTYEYKPGPKLMKHIQRIAIENGLNASKGYVDVKVQDLENKFEKLESAFDKLIMFLDPPVTSQKRLYYQANPQLLFMNKGAQKILKKVVEDFEENHSEESSSVHPDYSHELKN